MAKIFERELKHLEQRMTALSARVEENVQLAIKAVKTQDLPLATRIIADDEAVEHAATTDSDGVFVFDELPSGPCQVSAEADGYVAGGPASGRPASARIREAEPRRRPLQ